MSRNNRSLFMQKVILDGMKIDAWRMLQFLLKKWASYQIDRKLLTFNFINGIVNMVQLA